MTEELREGMYLSDRCQFCREFGEKVEPYLCPKCKERIEKLGYVRLDADQRLPGNLYSEDENLDPHWVCEATQQDMFNAGWRRTVK